MSFLCPVEGMILKFGPLAKITFSDGNALLAGLGAQIWTVDAGFAYITLGYKFKSPWYITASPFFAFMGNGFSLGVGYSISGGK